MIAAGLAALWVLPTVAAVTEHDDIEVASTQPATVTQRANAGSTAPTPPKMIHWFNAGWSSPDPEVRHVGRNIATRGWTSYVDRSIKPVLDAGCRRIGIHNPFGAQAGEPMDFDQAVEVTKLDNRKLQPDKFVKAWLPVTRGDYTNGEPVEVIAYIGDLDGDPDMVRRRDKWLAGSDKHKKQWARRAMQSVQPLIDAGCSIGLDSSTGFEENGPEHRFLLDLEKRGVTVYIEAWPDRESTWLHGRPVIILDRSYDKRVEPWFDNPPEKRGWPASIDQVGEVVRLIGPREGEHWAWLNRPDTKAYRIMQITRAGHTPAGRFTVVDTATLARVAAAWPDPPTPIEDVPDTEVFD